MAQYHNEDTKERQSYKRSEVEKNAFLKVEKVGAATQTLFSFRFEDVIRLKSFKESESVTAEVVFSAYSQQHDPI